MGWKNIKEHYRITHIVQVTKQGICIGSPYVHDLIVVGQDGTVNEGSLGISSNEHLQRYASEMRADREKLISLIISPDSFERSITVYTYRDAEIIEKQCEEEGWPNVTHDGDLMYADRFSTEKEKVVAWAKLSADFGIELLTSRVEELRNDLLDRESRLENEKQIRAKLEIDYPAVLPEVGL